MTGISFQFEPRLAIKNRTPLTRTDIINHSYIATLVKSDGLFVITLSLARNDGSEKPIVNSNLFPEKAEKLANDSMSNIIKAFPSKEVDILYFDDKTTSEEELQEMLSKWMKETATTPS